LKPENAEKQLPQFVIQACAKTLLGDFCYYRVNSKVQLTVMYCRIILWLLTPLSL